MNEYIYRVVVKTTGSLQPGGTTWQRRAIYCGPSLRDARIAYLREEPDDRGFGGYGNASRETIIERHDARPEKIDDTTPESVVTPD